MLIEFSLPSYLGLDKYCQNAIASSSSSQNTRYDNILKYFEKTNQYLFNRYSTNIHSYLKSSDGF